MPLISKGSWGTTANGSLVLPKTSGAGLLVNTTAPDYGWKDMLGQVNTRPGATNPTLAVYRGGIYQFQMVVATADEVFNEYHVQHDYAPVTSMFIHTHWSHAATTVTGGSVTWSFELTYAKGYNQAAFVAPITITVVQNASTTQYQHMIAEVEFSSNGGDGTHLDYNLFEPDGLILSRTTLSANNITVSGGPVPAPFLHFVDDHYQSTQTATKNRNAPFYT